MKEKIKRQVRVIDPEIEERQLDELAEDPRKADQILQKKLYGKASARLQNAVTDIEDKHREMQRLEESVAECLALMKDIALLVQHQGEQITSIEENVRQAKEYVQEANKNLEEAKEEHKCSQK